jgi:nicotinate phosphoribosyltransferase
VTQALKTDLYQLTMAAAYHRRGIAAERVTCEAFLRRLPPRRSFLVMAGVPRLVEYLANLRFSAEDVAFLRTLPQLAPALESGFADVLLGFRFGADVWAAPEGSVVFANEPLVRVTGSLLEAQIVETYLLSVLNHAIKVASKAARVVLAAAPADVVEFGSRRTHDEAAIDAARAAWVAGCAASANVEAGRRHGVPVVGTAAHMLTMAHARPGVPHTVTERESFVTFVETFPHEPILLVDTYDTPAGIDNAIAAAGEKLGGIRLDSGDLLELSCLARAKLDAAGLTRARIIASSGLDEHTIAGLVAAGAPIDAYGVGENITEPVDAPITGVVYKLVANHTLGTQVAKKSSGGKSTRPGVKQVWRLADRDVVGLADEPPPPNSRPLLVQTMTAGRPLALPSAAGARVRCAADLAALPEAHRRIPVDPDEPAPPAWPVEISPGLEAATVRALGG